MSFQPNNFYKTLFQDLCVLKNHYILYFFVKIKVYLAHIKFDFLNVALCHVHFSKMRRTVNDAAIL